MSHATAGTRIHDLTVADQARLIRSRQLGAVELVDHYLGRIDRHSAAVGAFITVAAEEARVAAAAVDRQLVGGRGHELDALGPYAGVPMGIKDLTLTAGIRTTFGSAALTDFVPTVDSAVVRRLRHAGFVLVGKTNVPEFGPTCYTESAVAPPARTPWDLTLSASGSSGGAAAAVAAGLLPVAHGSDGGGSVRTPAANCGLVGFKPSRGRVSPAPTVDIMGTSTDGILARSVADAAALLDVLVGPETGDRFGAIGPGGPYLDALAEPPGRLRIARCVDPGNGATVHQGVVAAVDNVAATLTRLGHDVEDVAHPMHGAYADIQDDVAGLFAVGVSTAVASLVPESRRHLLRPFTRLLLDRGIATGAPEFVLSLQRLFAAASTALRAQAEFDILLTPTTTAPAVRVGGLRNDDDPSTEIPAMLAWTAFTPPYNLTGQPAVSLPLGCTATGLPLGVQLVGRPGADDRLLRVAAQLEEASPWSHRHPPMWDE